MSGREWERELYTGLSEYINSEHHHPPTVEFYWQGTVIFSTREFYLRFEVVYLVLYMFSLLNIKEKTSNTTTVSYNMDSCPFG